MPTQRPTQILLALLLCLALLAAPTRTPQANAQEATAAVPTDSAAAPAVAYSIRPVGVEDSAFFDNVEVSPGESTSLEIRVLNLGTEAVDLRVYKANANNPSNGGIVAGQENDEELTATQMIQFSAQEVNLAVGESVDLPFEVSVPMDTKPGQYVAVFAAGTVETQKFSGSDSVDYRITYFMPISILVPGELTYGFELGDPTLKEGNLIVPVTNTGNYRLRPEGSLELKNAAGDTVLTAEIALNSIYNGSSTNISVSLNAPLPKDSYSLTLSLRDPESGAEASIEDRPVEIVEAEEAAEFTLDSISIKPNAEEIVFANVNLVITNNGQQLQATNISLDVLRDDVLVDTHAIATNQVMLQGENTYTSVYAPSSGEWEYGTYTFRLRLESVDPNGQQQIELLNVDIEQEIVVP